ncbi:MAG: hypothetical protein IRD7MM_02455 [Candidatus Midichloria mitochondrii]
MIARSNDVEQFIISCRYSKRLIDKLLSKNREANIKG